MLNRINLNKFKAKHAPLLFIGLSLAFALNITGCGKRKPPLPPVERVVQRVEISGNQVGDRINLTWQMPARNISGGNLLNIARADIYRLAEPLDAPLSLTEEEFAARSTHLASIPLTDADFGLKTKTYSDHLRFTGQEARLRYAIRFVNASGQKAAFSNFLLIEPTSRIAESPKSLKIDVTQTDIKLTWITPQKNVDGTTPPNILGYNVYRKKLPETEVKKLNDTPLKDPNYSDNFFEFGQNYSYFVRTVSLGKNGEPVESTASETFDIFPKDIFPPAAPDSITIAAAPNNISIFFAANLEKDVIGYRVYRSLSPDLPKGGWQLLTKEPLKTNTFQDTKTDPGKTYYYYLTAIDNAGNVSEASEVVSETAF